jgi:hypothetical protein
MALIEMLGNRATSEVFRAGNSFEVRRAIWYSAFGMISCIVV